MNVKQISVVLDNIPGALCKMTDVLAEKRISIRALTVADSADFSTVRLIVDNVLWASSVLTKAGFRVSSTDVLAVEVMNVPGGLNKLLHLLREAGVNIEYMYAIGGRYSSFGGNICLVFKFADSERAAEVLTSGGIRLLGHGDLGEVSMTFPESVHRSVGV